MTKIWLIALSIGVMTLSACSSTKNAQKDADAAAEQALQEALKQIETIDLDTMSVEASTPLPYYNTSERRVHDLIDTKLELSFDFAKRHAIGKATLKLKPYFYPSSQLQLDAKGFIINEVALMKNASKTPLKYEYNDLIIDIQLDKEYKSTEEYTIFIDYVARPDELEPGGSLAITSDKGLYFIDPDESDKNKPTQIWTQGETEASSCWFPTIDSPNERTSQEMFITVPDKYVSLSNGKFMKSTPNADGTRTDHWKQEKPHAPYLFAMAIGEYAVIKDKWRTMDVHYYVEPDYAPFARGIFGDTPEMLEFFSNTLGYDYPWDKYHQVIVRDFVSGAMENTSCSIYMEALNQTDRELIDGNYEDIVAHELFHHWFGDLVTCESWANLPLNESFATYGEYLWLEHKRGRDEGDYHIHQDMEQYKMESRQKQEPLIRYYHEDKEDMFDAHSYQKGGRVLHMLRKYVGDDAFFKALNLYLKDNEFQSVEIHDLRLAFEEITGEDLNWFFTQWFLSAGHPDLKVKSKYDEANKSVDITLKQKQDHDVIYKLPVAVDIYKGSEATRTNLVFTEKEQTISIPYESKPDLINFDAEKMLLGVIKEKKPLDQSIHQFNHAPLFMDRFEALQECDKEQLFEEEAQMVMMKALDDPYWKIKAEAIDRIKIESNIKEELKTKLLTLVKNDDDTAVKSKALNKLSEFEGEDFTDLYKAAIKDSSYRMAAAGLTNIANTDEAAALSYAKEFEDEKNSSISNAVASIYADNGGEVYQPYFENKLATADGFGTYSLLQHYNTYLNNANSHGIVEKGVATIKNIATDHDAWWVRYQATNTILQVKNNYKDQLNEFDGSAGSDQAERDQLQLKIDKFNEIIQGIKDQETNEQLQMYYSMMN